MSLHDLFVNLITKYKHIKTLFVPHRMRYHHTSTSDAQFEKSVSFQFKGISLPTILSGQRRKKFQNKRVLQYSQYIIFSMISLSSEHSGRF